MSTYTQANALLEDLKKASVPRLSWQIGKATNVLLEQAKNEEPENPVLAALEPLNPGPGGTYIRDVSCDDVRAIVGQIVAATKPGPMVA